MKRLLVIALAACALQPGLAQAELRRQNAGACEVLAPEPEDPALRWDYWWSGACSGALATGPGFLLQYMMPGGFGDVYAATLVQGRMQGALRVYGSRFLGAEWRVRAARVAQASAGAGEGTAEGEGGGDVLEALPGTDGTPQDAPALDEVLPRFALPTDLQAALVRFAREVGHPQMPALPVAPQPLRCPAFVDAQGAPNAQGRGTDVLAFIRAHESPEAARQDALLQALQAPPQAAGVRAGPDEPRRRLALATAVSGCAATLAR